MDKRFYLRKENLKDRYIKELIKDAGTYGGKSGWVLVGSIRDLDPNWNLVQITIGCHLIVTFVRFIKHFSKMGNPPIKPGWFPKLRCAVPHTQPD